MIYKIFRVSSYYLLFGVFFLTAISRICSQSVIPLSSVKDLEALRESNKGKVTLVNFWATWCKPCVAEFPELVKLYSNYKDKNFEIIFISVDVPEDVDGKVIPFLKKEGIDFITYYNKFDKPDELINFFDKKWEGAIPSTYIYDKNWVQTSSMLGRKTYDMFEKEILKNLN